MTDHELVPIAEYSNRTEAELGRVILEANDVAAALAGDDAGGMNPWIHPVTPVRLLVRIEDADRAREILDSPQDEMHTDME